MDDAGPESAGTPALRASDAEREHVVGALREHLVAGRLTLDEFSERVDAAHAARTIRDLEALRRDLPETSAPLRASRRTPTRSSVAVMGSVERRTRWRLPERTVAVAVMGSCVLDLRRAEIESDEVEITAVAVMGGVDVIVPEGVDVELTGFAVMGGKEAHVKDTRPVPGSPFVRVHAFAFMGGVTVRSKPRSRRALSPAVERPSPTLELTREE